MRRNNPRVRFDSSDAIQTILGPSEGKLVAMSCTSSILKWRLTIRITTRGGGSVEGQGAAAEDQNFDTNLPRCRPTDQSFDANQLGDQEVRPPRRQVSGPTGRRGAPQRAHERPMNRGYETGLLPLSVAHPDERRGLPKEAQPTGKPHGGKARTMSPGG